MSGWAYNVIPSESISLAMFPLKGSRITDEKWKCAYELFGRALELPASQRLIFTQSATSDPEVLRLALELIEGTQDEDSEEPSGLVLKAGDRIGRYEVTGKVGQGGMGSVYSARDTDLRRMAALKVLAPGLGATELATERLVREAKAASALNHPNIVTVYEVIRADGQIALAMELVEGRSLRSYCGQPQPIGRVIDWGRQVAKALAAAHEHGIVHGDIKPENLMVRPDGYIKVLDFGLARQLMPAGQAASTNFSGMPGGTLNYMSPEQTRGERPTRASDIFSLGLMLYELATSRHAFATDSPIDTAHAIAHGTPKPVSALSPKIPAAFDRLIGSMLAKDPSKRPSAEEVGKPADRDDRNRTQSYAAASESVVVDIQLGCLHCLWVRNMGDRGEDIRSQGAGPAANYYADQREQNHGGSLVAGWKKARLRDSCRLNPLAENEGRFHPASPHASRPPSGPNCLVY
ncbi:MAG: serine/threonine protein kinase [Acidobacteriaceae bacterium]|nr:serine/threonine protein kinase [Acidobacteriaceae bacterium]